MASRLSILWAGFILALFPLVTSAEFVAFGYDIPPNANTASSLILGDHILSGPDILSLGNAVCEEFGTKYVQLKNYTSSVSGYVLWDSQYNLDGTTIHCFIKYGRSVNPPPSNFNISTSNNFGSGIPTKGPGSDYYDQCPVGEVIESFHIVGTVGDEAHWDMSGIPTDVCQSNCTYVIDESIYQTWVIIDPDLHGCTYNEIGQASGCSPDAPFAFDAAYVATGDICLTASGAVTPPPLPGENTGGNTDLTGVENSIDSLNQSLTIDGADPDSLVLDSMEYNWIEDSIIGVESGTFKPFGDAIENLFPDLQFGGSCILENNTFNLTVGGFNKTVDLSEYCVYLDMIKAIMDLVFWLVAWLFVYQQFAHAIRDV